MFHFHKFLLLLLQKYKWKERGAPKCRKFKYKLATWYWDPQCDKVDTLAITYTNRGIYKDMDRKLNL